jgi:hypothetical protein
MADQERKPPRRAATFPTQSGTEAQLTNNLPDPGSKPILEQNTNTIRELRDREREVAIENVVQETKNLREELDRRTRNATGELKSNRRVRTDRPSSPYYDYHPSDNYREYDTKPLKVIFRNTRSLDDDGSDSTDSDSSEDSFSLPSSRSRDLSATLVALDSKDTVESDKVTLSNSNTSRLGVTHNVYQSEYTGDGSYGGLHTASLVTVKELQSSHKPLFRWV